MEPLKLVKVNIGDLEFYIRYSNRAFFYYLSMEDSTDLNNYDRIIHYFYDLAKVGTRAEGKKFDYSFDEFYELIDPYQDAMGKMMDAINELFEPEPDQKKTKIKK